MPLMSDVFSQDAFSFVNLSAAVEELPYIESRLGEMGLFNGFVEGTETDTVVIDKTQGIIKILGTSERGAPPQRASKQPKANSRSVKIPHIDAEDRVVASSLFGKRKPGTTVLESVADKINKQFSQMIQNELEPTREVHRLNALRGILLDSDGSVIEDFYSLFGETQDTFDFDLASTADVREQTHQLKRKIRNSLDGVGFSGIHLLCSASFYDAIAKHGSVRETFLNWQNAVLLREDMVEDMFKFGSAMFEDYRGMSGLGLSDVDGVTPLGEIEDGYAIAFPQGVPGMYRTYHAPGTFLETVNTIGQPLYAKVAPDWKYNRHVDQLIETNPLYINTRPRAVLKVGIV